MVAGRGNRHVILGTIEFLILTSKTLQLPPRIPNRAPICQYFLPDSRKRLDSLETFVSKLSLLTPRRRSKIYFATLALLLRESARPCLRPSRHKSSLDKAFPSNSNLDCRYRNYNLELAWITAFSKLRNPLFPVCVDSNSYNHQHLPFSADCSSIQMPAPPPNSFQALRKSAKIPLPTTTANTKKFLN